MRRSFSHRLETEYYDRPRPGRRGSYAPLEPYLLSWVDPIVFRDRRILEIGAGHALYSRMIAERFAPKQVIALDLVPAQLGACRQRDELGRVLAVGGDCLQLPFRDDSCDVVFGSLILHRFHELEAVLAEVCRVLANPGLYLGIEPSVMNPMHLFRHMFSSHSPNEILLGRGAIGRAFTRTGFQVETRCLSPRFPLLSHLGLATCLGIRARWVE